VISTYLYTALATARRNDLIAEAQAARLAREARANRRQRIKARTRREPGYGPSGAARLTRSAGQPAPVVPEVTS
jgi:hypothetical protein